jgi:hypothetical protein
MAILVSAENFTAGTAKNKINKQQETNIFMPVFMYRRYQFGNGIRIETDKRNPFRFTFA